MSTILFKSAIRHLWKSKLFTMLNILGLAVGIASCWVIFKIARYEFSFENGVPHLGQTYRLVSRFAGEDKDSFNSGVSRPIYQAIQKEVPGIKNVVPLFRNYNIATTTIHKGSANEKLFEDFDEAKAMVMETNKDYFDLVGYRWLAGSPQNAFSKPDNVVLTKDRAKIYFPKTPVNQLIGQTITYNDSLPKTVSGIVENLTFPSEFNGSEFTVLKNENYPLNVWTNTNGSDRLYIRLAPDADPSSISNTINPQYALGIIKLRGKVFNFGKY